MDKNKVRVRFIIYTLKVKLCREREALGIKYKRSRLQ